MLEHVARRVPTLPRIMAHDGRQRHSQHLKGNMAVLKISLSDADFLIDTARHIPARR